MPADLPEPIQLDRTEVKEDAGDRLESARRILFLFVLFAFLNTAIIIASWPHFPPANMVMIATTEAVLAAFVLSVAGWSWSRARGNQQHYATRTRITWKLSCRDVEHSWDVTGFGPCEGWRDVRVACTRLPKRKGKWLAVPGLRVLVDNGERALASKKLSESEDSGHLRITDKFGKPLRIMLTQERPEEASLDEPWEVEITVESDPNPPDTLTATALASGVGEATHD